MKESTMHKLRVHVEYVDCRRVFPECTIHHLANKSDTICKSDSLMTMILIEPRQYSHSHLLSLNLRVLVAEIDSVKTAHLSSKLLRLLGRGLATDNSIL
jgi:hypothetical protein